MAPTERSRSDACQPDRAISPPCMRSPSPRPLPAVFQPALRRRRYRPCRYNFLNPNTPYHEVLSCRPFCYCRYFVGLCRATARRISIGGCYATASQRKACGLQRGRRGKDAKSDQRLYGCEERRKDPCCRGRETRQSRRCCCCRRVKALPPT